MDMDTVSSLLVAPSLPGSLVDHGLVSLRRAGMSQHAATAAGAADVPAMLHALEGGCSFPITACSTTHCWGQDVMAPPASEDSDPPVPPLPLAPGQAGASKLPRPVTSTLACAVLEALADATDALSLADALRPHATSCTVRVKCVANAAVDVVIVVFCCIFQVNRARAVVMCADATDMVM